MTDRDSCLVQKLSHYVVLEERSRNLIKDLERDKRHYQKGDEVHGPDTPNDELYVVSHGWLYSYTGLPDGRRQIVRIHHPGDVIGFMGVPYQQRIVGLHACEDVTVCPFPARALGTIFEQSPQLTSLFYMLSAREHVCLLDTLCAMGRMSARERIAFLLMQLLVRLRVGESGGRLRTSIRMPLNQTEIGDTLGLTNVTVSKTLNMMEDDGLIRRTAERIDILKEVELVRLCSFNDRYSDLRTDWMPTQTNLAA